MTMRGLIFTLAIFFTFAPNLWAACTGADCLPKKVRQSCLQSSPNGCIDWEKGIIYATGMGIPNPAHKSPQQKKYGAYQAALVVAKRNLLQMVEDVQISSSQTVKEGMLESDVIKTEIHGSLRQVMEEGKPRLSSDGTTWVTVKMYMRDIMNALSKNEGFALAEDASFKSTVDQAPKTKNKKLSPGGDVNSIYTGLILDARGSGVKPAMSPKVYGAQGEELYGSFMISRKYALEFGVAGYVKDLEKAKANERVRGNPLLLKAKVRGSATGADLQLNEGDAKLLKELNKSQTFLREARVIILL